MKSNARGADQLPQAELEVAYSKASQDAELLRAVIDARARLAEREHIQGELVRRAREHVKRCEERAIAAGVKLAELPA